MSATPKSSAVVVPTVNGEAKPAEAAAVTGMKGGGLLLSPLPLTGGKKKSKTRRLSKKVLKMFKKGSAKKLARLMKGGNEGEDEVVTEGEGAETGAARKKRGTKRQSRKGSRKHGMLY
jgi:hypothetical protein